VRAYDCLHEDEGKTYKITGADDEELFRNAKAHMDEYHMDLGMTDDQIRETLSANAYDE
jgi:predicted small metal-binding protein